MFRMWSLTLWSTKHRSREIIFFPVVITIPLNKTVKYKPFFKWLGKSFFQSFLTVDFVNSLDSWNPRKFSDVKTGHEVLKAHPHSFRLPLSAQRRMSRGKHRRKMYSLGDSGASAMCPFTLLIHYSGPADVPCSPSSHQQLSWKPAPEAFITAVLSAVLYSCAAFMV